MKHTDWYKDAVIYQIYPRSFCDGNNDGLGDIPGIISKLDYLKELGVNCVWLSPVYDSPQEDNGYDISNYRDIYKPFGTLDDFKVMIKEMHKRGIRLIMDLVVNHTSNEHEWFKSAISDPNSPYRDYYIIKRGRKNGKKPPNNWSSFFMGSAWERIGDSEDYYLHLFAKGQPDLNWENPKVREEVKDILRYWLDMGVDGFRCDVITLISKEPSYKNGKLRLGIVGCEYFINGPKLHEYLHELYEDVYSQYDCMTVGETVLSSLEDAQKLVDPKREELSMVFNFDHTDADNYMGIKYLYRKFKIKRWKKTFKKWQDGLYQRGWNSLFIENHDQRRSSGRFGTIGHGPLKDISSKMLATSYFLLQGTPFIYQGQEIGMTNADFKSIEEYKDVEINNFYKSCQKNFLLRTLIGKHMFEVSRDNARTPMQWNNEKYAGFSNVEPWIGVNHNKDTINVEESLKNENSLFHYYQKLIEVKKNNIEIRDGKYIDLLPKDKWVFAYSRKVENSEVVVICNFSDKEKRCSLLNTYKDYQLLLSNYGDNGDMLKPFEARVYKK